MSARPFLAATIVLAAVGCGWNDAVDSRTATAGLPTTRLLIEELNHRVKNTLAVVQNLARQSFRGDDASLPAREAFEQRLLALAAAHNVLTQRRWEAAGLREVAATAGRQVQKTRPRASKTRDPRQGNLL